MWKWICAMLMILKIHSSIQNWKKTPLSYKLPAHNKIGDLIGYSGNKTSGTISFKLLLCYYPKGCTPVKNMQNLFPPDEAQGLMPC